MSTTAIVQASVWLIRQLQASACDPRDLAARIDAILERLDASDVILVARQLGAGAVGSRRAARAAIVEMIGSPA